MLIISQDPRDAKRQKANFANYLRWPFYPHTVTSQKAHNGKDMQI
ncbi:hypothetical protein THTE_3139 [Thermogutta terrifontis]|uniref:Uncharacterized protein n=1 Tax=Thermogutta terrifontis TaxID=1331910 RepID=A0A286RIF2_9BACT|nr:hypothetical protein THTE_3139 [Thermogutta terrifontis]